MAMAHETPRDSRNAASFLVCRSNGCLCALPLMSVAETMRPLAIEPLAAMPPFLLGVSVIRGAPVPIVDTAKLLGSTTPMRPQRVVTLRIGERLVGLAVESVLGVRAIPHASRNQIPPLMQRIGDDTESAITRLDAEWLLVLEIARIVPESAWAAIDSEKVAI
jgi:purine-binding chemotaxis protein CheW